jgi:hypothetical protein
MALEKIDTLDMSLTALDGRENGIDLLIFDHGTTADETERYTLLTKKLAAYVNFVMSDAFRTENAQSKPTDVVIHVLCKNPPNSAMQTVQAVFPRGDRVNRIPVTFENLNEFITRLGGEVPAAVESKSTKKKWWPFSR